MAGLESPAEFLALCFDRIASRFTGHSSHIRQDMHFKRIHKKLLSMGYVKEDHYDLSGIKLPIMDANTMRAFFKQSFEDDYYIYLFGNDDYEEKIIDKYFYLLIEGPYCLKNNLIDVTVKAGDIVIDAGSWAGDFAAYASVKGAVTYAFEPSDYFFRMLEKTAELNHGIIPVMKALSDVTQDSSKIHGIYSSGHEDIFDSITIDDFVRENNIPRVDFIKSDIEGNERKMLAGAQETLRRFAPKLALCTYHLPDDPAVMSSLIRQANPKYNIIQKRMKLFASVPE